MRSRTHRFLEKENQKVPNKKITRMVLTVPDENVGLLMKMVRPYVSDMHFNIEELVDRRSKPEGETPAAKPRALTKVEAKVIDTLGRRGPSTTGELEKATKLNGYTSSLLGRLAALGFVRKVGGRMGKWEVVNGKA
jgi:hypothetical protein